MRGTSVAIAPRPGLTQPAKEALAEWVDSVATDPLSFVMGAYPWGQPGTPLEHHPGRDQWQEEFLVRLGQQLRAHAFTGREPVDPIRMAVSKGHGVGGSALAAMLVDFIMSTRPHCQGTVTANTATQLQTKTWAAVTKWTKMCVTAPWFAINTQRMYYLGHRDSWFCAPLTCQENRSEAFAGQHAVDSSSFYINDESSSVPGAIFDVEEGGLSDGEPMQFVFGNPTRAQGRFHDICFGKLRQLYDVTVVDSRTSRFTNKKTIQQWIDVHGIDSDFVRVRVLGLPPSASDLQFIDLARIQAAQRREVDVYDDDPLVCGLDVARGGLANSVFHFRQGLDARTIPRMVIPGAQSRDTTRLVSKAAMLLDQTFEGHRIEMLFVDATGVGGPIYDRLCQLGFEDRVYEVQFGGAAPDDSYANMRAYMWGKGREWLLRGAIDSSPQLESDLAGPDYWHDKHDRLVLESKEDMQERDLASPDYGDAFCWIAGTLIDTPDGPRPIETICAGDLVTTPFGVSPVVQTWVSTTERLTTAHFSNGAMLQGKGEHEVFTFSRGRVRLDALRSTDELDTNHWWRRLLWRCVSRWSTAARGSGFKALVATFSPGARIRRSDCCIDASGRIPMDRFRRIMRFITEMATGATTTRPIWTVCLAVNTSADTCLNGRNDQASWPSGEMPLKKLVLPPDTGTPLRAVSRGTANEGQRCGRSARLRRAVSAVLTSLTRLAGIGRKSVAPVAVRTDSASATWTYNLTLERDNAYYANGILVFNCLTFAAPVVAKLRAAHTKQKRDSFQGRKGGAGKGGRYGWTH